MHAVASSSLALTLTLPPTVTHGHHSLSVPHGAAGAGVVALASPCWCWRLLVLVCGDQLSVQCPVSSQRQRSYSDICCPCAVPVCPPCTATLRHYLPCCDVTPVSLSSVQCPHCPLPDTASGSIISLIRPTLEPLWHSALSTYTPGHTAGAGHGSKHQHWSADWRHDCSCPAGDVARAPGDKEARSGGRNEESQPQSTPWGKH